MTNEDFGRLALEQLEGLILSTPGVVGLHPGPWGEAGTYLPGGMVSGIRHTGDRLRVNIIADASTPLHTTTERLRTRLAGEVGVPVDIIIEDVA